MKTNFKMLAIAIAMTFGGTVNAASLLTYTDYLTPVSAPGTIGSVVTGTGTAGFFNTSVNLSQINANLIQQGAAFNFSLTATADQFLSTVSFSLYSNDCLGCDPGYGVDWNVLASNDGTNYSTLGTVIRGAWNTSQNVSYNINQTLAAGSTEYFRLVAINRDYTTDFGLVSTANYAINDLTITGDPVATPLPAAVWLFGSGLVGLMRFRKKAVVSKV